MRRRTQRIRAARLLSLSAPAALAALVLAAGAVPAAAKSGQTVGEVAYRKLKEVHEKLEASQYGEAKKLLDDLAERRLNPHEQALVQQSYGYTYSALERYDEAIRSFEQCLALDALPDSAALATQYNLAQLYAAQERYEEAARALEEWFSKVESPRAPAYYMLAVTYAQQGKMDEALAPALRAVEMSDEPREAWLQLLLSIYFEQKKTEKVAELLEQLVVRFPRKLYWTQLAAAYSELGREKDALAVLQLAYEQGELTKDSELRNLARTYLYHQIPYWAAHVLEKGLAEGQIEGDAQAWELLGNAWLHARERERALAPLRKAAELSDSGDLYVELAQIHIERESWQEAEAMLERALAKGGLRDPGQARVLLGIARFEQDKPEAARRAFLEARGYESSRKNASQWLRHLDQQAKQRAAQAG